MEELEQNETAPKPSCSNCGKKRTRKGKFCPNCGQKVFDGKVSIGEFMEMFMLRIIHFDSKFIRMITHLWVPGKVSESYFNGKIKQYPHPLQYFFIVMFLLLLGIHKKSEEKGSAIQINTTDENNISTSKTNDIAKIITEYGQGATILQEYKKLPDSLHSPATNEAVNKIARKVGGDGLRLLLKDTITNWGLDDSIPLNFFARSVKVSTVDIAQTPMDELLEIYPVESTTERMMFRQGVKALRDPKALTNQYLSSFSWSLLVLIAFQSWILFLMYRRTRAYFVEHFIFLLHTASAIFFAFAVLLAIDVWAFKIPVIVWVLTTLSAGIFSYFAMLRFYGKSRIRTFLKWLLFSFIGMIAFVVVFVATTMVVFFIF